MMVVKWSGCSPPSVLSSNPAEGLQILLLKLLLKRTKINKQEAGVGPLKYVKENRIVLC